MDSPEVFRRPPPRIPGPLPPRDPCDPRDLRDLRGEPRPLSPDVGRRVSGGSSAAHARVPSPGRSTALPPAFAQTSLSIPRSRM
ncbi:hypothetical protein [Nonomuraea sp. WAC 01424]|uniref:hypothetical protein n=1 Tax=Nonomuraea sp. WAC 01424 TaxID=2203200 RepID=UPI000F7A18D7|nr:hypothetical protein [Nonomuraea sp. WAC 01424]